MREGATHTRTIFTVGHSTRRIEELVALLAEAAIELVVDVRRYPASRRHPHFGRDALCASLRSAGVEYAHEPDLGGRREARSDSRNGAIADLALRGYADHMGSAEFRAAVERLVRASAGRRVAILCAEAEPTHCHRALLSDDLLTRGLAVRHLLRPGETRPHALAAAARPREGGGVEYPARGPAQLRLFGEAP